MPTIIIVNKKPNITHLPYTLKKRQGMQRFVPGNNEVDPQVMQAVVEQAGADWENYYANFLRPVGDPVDTAEALDLGQLRASEFVDLIEGQMAPDELQRYRRFEAAGDQRKTVLRAIDEQLEKINAIEVKKSAQGDHQGGQ